MLTIKIRDEIRLNKELSKIIIEGKTCIKKNIDYFYSLQVLVLSEPDHKTFYHFSN